MSNITDIKTTALAKAKSLIKRYLDDEELFNSEYATLHAVADSAGQILHNVIHTKWYEGELTDFLRGEYNDGSKCSDSKV